MPGRPSLDEASRECPCSCHDWPGGQPQGCVTCRSAHDGASAASDLDADTPEKAIELLCLCVERLMRPLSDADVTTIECHLQVIRDDLLGYWKKAADDSSGDSGEEDERTANRQATALGPLARVIHSPKTPDEPSGAFEPSREWPYSMRGTPDETGTPSEHVFHGVLRGKLANKAIEYFRYSPMWAAVEDALMELSPGSPPDVTADHALREDIELILSEVFYAPDSAIDEAADALVRRLGVPGASDAALSSAIDRLAEALELIERLYKNFYGYAAHAEGDQALKDAEKMLGLSPPDSSGDGGHIGPTDRVECPPGHEEKFGLDPNSGRCVACGGRRPKKAPDEPSRERCGEVCREASVFPLYPCPRDKGHSGPCNFWKAPDETGDVSLAELSEKVRDKRMWSTDANNLLRLAEVGRILGGGDGAVVRWAVSRIERCVVVHGPIPDDVSGDDHLCGGMLEASRLKMAMGRVYARLANPTPNVTEARAILAATLGVPVTGEES